MRLILMTLCILAAPLSQAAISGSVGAGVGSCDSVSRLLASSWWDVKNIMLSGEKKKRKPRAGDFRCISPWSTRGMSQVTVPALLDELKCFSSQQYPSVCCDAKMQACASL